MCSRIESVYEKSEDLLREILVWSTRLYCRWYRRRGETRNQEPCQPSQKALDGGALCLICVGRARKHTSEIEYMHTYMRDQKQPTRNAGQKAVGQKAKARARMASVAKFHLTRW